MQDIFTSAFWISVFSSAIRLATPILAAALGEIYTQRAGIMNLGLEGTMLMGALGGFLGTYFTGSLFVGILCGIAIGMLMSLIMGFLSISMRGNQVIAGTVAKSHLLKMRSGLSMASGVMVILSPLAA